MTLNKLKLFIASILNENKLQNQSNILPAILWDGNKQIHGQLLIGELALEFMMRDFSLTNLNLRINYDQITEISYYRLFSILDKAVKINSGIKRENIFVTDHPEVLLRSVKKRMKQKK